MPSWYNFSAILFQFLCKYQGFPGGSDGKEICLQCRRPRFNPWVGQIPWRKEWLLTPVFLPGEFHGQRSLAGYSPWDQKESDTTEWLHFDFSLSCIGEGNGNHFSVLAWRIPGTGEPGGLPSMGSHRVGHDWSDLAVAHTHIHTCTHTYPFV